MTMCKQPDRDEPRMTCGYPLPCPWHTVVVDISTTPTTITEPTTARVGLLARERLRQVAVELQAPEPVPPPEPPKRRGKRARRA